jgi:hypothetical protein
LKTKRLTLLTPLSLDSPEPAIGGKGRRRSIPAPRNLRAAECLSKLAAEATALTDADWLMLKPHAGWASETFRDGITQAARAVGFQNKITDLRSYVEHLLHILAQPQSIAA